MPAAQTHLNTHRILIGGVDQKSFSNSISVQEFFDMTDGKGIADRHEAPTRTGKGLRISGSLYDNVSGGGRVSLKNVGTFTLGGNSYAGQLKSVNFNRTVQHAGNQGSGTEFRYPVYAGGEVTSISVELSVPTAGAPAFLAGLSASGQAAVVLNFSMTINGVTHTIGSVVESYEHTWSPDSLQTVTVNLKGNGVSSSPSGTGSILAAAINAPETTVPIVVTSKSAGGLEYCCDGLIESVSFQCSESGLYTLDYSYVSVGTYTVTATT